jgi:hypothetical protein
LFLQFRKTRCSELSGSGCTRVIIAGFKSSFCSKITRLLLAYCLLVTANTGVIYETAKQHLHGSELELAAVDLVAEASERHQSAGRGRPSKASCHAAEFSCCRDEIEQEGAFEGPLTPRVVTPPSFYPKLLLERGGSASFLPAKFLLGTPTDFHQNGAALKPLNEKMRHIIYVGL